MKPIIHFVLGYIFLIRKSIIGKWNYFLWHQNVQLAPLINTHYNRTSNLKRARNSIIFMANGFVLHGGLADRIKGILSVYSWCLSRNVEFKIHFVYPFPLNKYLLPNEYDWTIDENDIFYDHSTKVSYLMLDSVSHSMSQTYIAQKTFQWMDKEWLDYNGQIHVYTNVDCCQDSYSKLFSSLFKPSEELSSLLSEANSIIGKNYITISFRFTTLLGDFNDCINDELPIEEQNRLIELCLCAINQISSKHSADCKAVVISDSEKFLSKASDLPRVHILSGKVGHSDHDTNSATHLKTFLDFFMISNASKVYLVKSGLMYNSAFPRVAALIGNKPFEIIDLQSPIKV